MNLPSSKLISPPTFPTLVEAKQRLPKFAARTQQEFAVQMNNALGKEPAMVFFVFAPEPSRRRIVNQA